MTFLRFFSPAYNRRGIPAHELACLLEVGLGREPGFNTRLIGVVGVPRRTDRGITRIVSHHRRVSCVDGFADRAVSAAGNVRTARVHARRSDRPPNAGVVSVDDRGVEISENGVAEPLLLPALAVQCGLSAELNRRLKILIVGARGADREKL